MQDREGHRRAKKEFPVTASQVAVQTAIELSNGLVDDDGNLMLARSDHAHFRDFGRSPGELLLQSLRLIPDMPRNEQDRQGRPYHRPGADPRD